MSTYFATIVAWIEADTEEEAKTEAARLTDLVNESGSTMLSSASLDSVEPEIEP